MDANLQSYEFVLFLNFYVLRYVQIFSLENLVVNLVFATIHYSTLIKVCFSFLITLPNLCVCIPHMELLIGTHSF